MAKKKKAIEEQKAPLRGDGGGTPPNCNSYIVHDPNHELAMKVIDGSVDGVWLDGVDISGGGGGGGGGLTVSTINVHATVSNNNDVEFTFRNIGTTGQYTGCVYGMEVRNIGGSHRYFAVDYTDDLTETDTYPYEFVIVDTDFFHMAVSNGEITNVTGYATWNGLDPNIYISGDCDIYITTN